MRILGLDASTSNIGLAVLDHDIKDGYTKLAHLECYQPPELDILLKLQAVRKFIQEKINYFKPDEVALEEIILFMKGASTAATISSLAVLNRTVGLAVLDALGSQPHLYNVLSIRHAIKETKELPSKEEIPELVAKILGIKFPYIYKKGKIVSQNQDMADAIAAALAYIKFYHNPKKDPELKKKVKKKKTKVKKKKVNHKK